MDDARRCTATNRSGGRCGRAAILGGTVCDHHGGKAPAVRAAAYRRLAERDAARVLGDVDVLEIGNPLERLAAVTARVAALEEHLASLLADVGLDAPTEKQAAVFHAWERALDRLERYLTNWARLGFDERMVNLAERQAELVEAYVIAVVTALPGVTVEQIDAAPATAAEHLELLTGTAA
jgi:hypothetical protein